MTALSGSHQPAQPVQVVNGQTQLQFTGLRPATTYQVVVTAYINLQSTASTPVTFTTAARGPDPPTSVQTRADGHGDWVVSWTPCTAADCYVPADSWNVIGAACGSAFVGQPPVVEVPAGQTSVTISAATLGLLGDSLTFTVQGVLASGLTGNPTSDHGCTQAWRPAEPGRHHPERSGRPDPGTRTITATPPGGDPGLRRGRRPRQPQHRVRVLGRRDHVGPTTATDGHRPGPGRRHRLHAERPGLPERAPAAAVIVTGPAFSRT